MWDHRQAYRTVAIRCHVSPPKHHNENIRLKFLYEYSQYTRDSTGIHTFKIHTILWHLIAVQCSTIISTEKVLKYSATYLLQSGSGRKNELAVWGIVNLMTPMLLVIKISDTVNHRWYCTELETHAYLRWYINTYRITILILLIFA